jgi:hypothetical protein
MTEIAIVRTERLELAFAPRPWPFAIERRAEIDRHFAEVQRRQPAIWNGRILVLHEHAIEDAVFRGAYLETDYASLIAWRDWDFPAADIKNCFAMAAIRGADGPFLLGIQGAHTAGAGKIYFVAGTPDPSDIVDGAVSLDGNLWREVAEEAGLAAGDFEAEPGWHTVFAGPRIAQIKVLRARQSARELRARILEHLARETQPELDGIAIAGGAADLDPRMPDFVAAFLNHAWAQA